MVLHREGCGHPPAAVPPAPWECTPRAPLQTPRKPSSSDARRPDRHTCPQQEGPLAGSARPHPEPASCPSVSEMGTVRSSLYLLGPSLQLLPPLHTELPHAGQQVMRGNEHPGAQEKREDVRPLKTEMERVTRESGPVWSPGVARLTLPHGPAAPQTQHRLHSSAHLECPSSSSLLPNPAHQARHRQNPTWQRLSATSPDELSSQCSYSAGSLPYPLPNPTLGTKSEHACWGDPPDLGGAAAQAAVLPGSGAKGCSVASEAGPGWWWVCGGLVCGVGQALLGPRIPHQKLLQASVTSQLRGSHPPATPGPPVPRPRVLVTGLWCRLRGARGLRGGRTQSSQKLLSDVDSARPLPADRVDLGVRRLLGALPGTLVRQ